MVILYTFLILDLLYIIQPKCHNKDVPVPTTTQNELPGAVRTALALQTAPPTGDGSERLQVAFVRSSEKLRRI